MNHKSTYNLTVLDKPVTITFKRINDSRRLQTMNHGQKKPNLFQVRGAMQCAAILPVDFTSKWWQEHYPNTDYHAYGNAFCWHGDKWNSKKGRHESLATALTYPGTTPEVNTAIWAAFLAEEQKRAKAKGPAGKSRRRSRHVPKYFGLQATLRKLNATLERLAPPVEHSDVDRLMAEMWSPPKTLESAQHTVEFFEKAVQRTVDAAENIHPVDMPHCTPTCNANLIPGAAHNCALGTFLESQQ